MRSGTHGCTNIHTRGLQQQTRLPQARKHTTVPAPKNGRDNAIFIAMARDVGNELNVDIFVVLLGSGNLGLQR